MAIARPLVPTPNRTTSARAAILRCLTALAVVAATLATSTADPVSAAGTPDILVTKTMPAEALLGGTIPVQLTISNPTATDGFNLLIHDQIPAGVSYVNGSASPAPQEYPQLDGSTILVWSNLADSLAGTTFTFDYSIRPDASIGLGDVVTNDVTAVVNDDPRDLPVVDTDGALVPSSYTGNDDDSASTTLTAIEITKSENSEEDELLRGVHDHKTVFTLEVENNLIDDTTGISVVDHLPASLEFLGCGGADNSTPATEEYPGSGRIDDTVDPALPNGACVVPSSVTTVTTDPDGAGPLPSGVYTRVEWNSAAIAAGRGTADLTPGASFAIDYIAAVPLRENVDPGPATATANLDNNTGPLTTETEALVRNHAEASGLYQSVTASSSTTTENVVGEDLTLHKRSSTETFAQGTAITYTLEIESSEYATGTGTITVSDTLPPSVDFTSANPVPTTGPTLNGDGTLTLTWDLPGFTNPNDATIVTIETTVRQDYRLGDGSSGSPVASDDSFTNIADVAADVTVITGPSTTSVVPLTDDSSASATAGSPSIEKQVSVPLGSGVLTCGDGTGITFDDDTASSYRPGDRVCFRLGVDFPVALDTLSPVVQDYLPNGFELDTAAAGGGWVLGATNTVASGDITFDDSSPLLQWDLADIDAGGERFEVVVQVIANDPLAAEDSDFLENLMKFRYGNLAGEVFQERDDAFAQWAEPELTLDKGILDIDNNPVAGAPADSAEVEEGEEVTFQVLVINDGSRTASNVSVRDVFPSPITCADITSISNSGTCNAAGYIEWDGASALTVNGTSQVALTYDVTVPAGVSAGAQLVNRAGVRSYTGLTNTGTPFTFVPADNIDPSLTPNTDAADEDAELTTPDPVVDKVRTGTSITETGNSASEATIGETISYDVTVTLPAGLTYENGVVSDQIDAEKDMVDGTVSATVNGGALPAGYTLTVDGSGNNWTLDLPDPLAVPSGSPITIVVSFDAVVLDVASNTRNTITPNTARLDYTDANSTARAVTDTVNTFVVEPNITLDKSDDAGGTVVANATVNYSLDVTNDDTPARTSIAHDVVVVDTVPDELIVLDAPGGSPAGDGATIGPDNGTWNATLRTITWTITSIDPGSTVVLDYQTTVDDPIAASTSIVNNAVATATSMAGTVAGERSAASPNGDPGSGYDDPATNTIAAASLDGSKAASPATITVGETVTYTLDAVIPAGVIAYDVTIIDDIPAGIEFEQVTSVSCDEGGGACSPDITAGDMTIIPTGPYSSGDDIAFFFGDLATPAAGDRTITIVYEAAGVDVAAAADGATLTNSATTYWNQTDSIGAPPAAIPAAGSFDTTGPTASDGVDVVEPSLVLDKDVSGQTGDTDTRRAIPGDTLTYTVVVTNDGTSPAHDIVVTDVPTDATWAFADTTAAAGVINSDSNPVGGLEWTYAGPLAPTESITITYTLTVPLGFDESDEIPGGPEQSNTADVSEYYGLSSAFRTANPTRDARMYDDVTPDTVTIEVDLASIGDLVWFDANGDGDPTGEPPLANVDVTVTWYGPDDNPGGGDDVVYTDTTDASGLWLIEDLPGGNYDVTVDAGTLPPGMTPSFDLDGTTVSPNGTWVGALAEDDAKRDVDFGYEGTGSIGDTVWFDQDGDGSKDTGEAGFSGVDVTVTWFGVDGVLGGGDDVVYTDTTDADGEYLVENLPAGNYTVVVDTADLAADLSIVSDPDGGADSAAATTLTAGEDDLTLDFGYDGPGSIGDTVYLDEDGNGAQNGAEQGLDGVTVELVSFGPNGVTGGGDDSTFTTSTDSNGNYLFENLPVGNYQVTVQGGVTLTVNTDDPDEAGAPDTGDSMSTTTLTALALDDLDQDFGYATAGLLGDRVYFDVNGNGTDDGEPGIEGVDVTATGPLGLTFSTTTDANGDYLFDDLPDGSWTVTIDPGTLPAGMSPTADDDGIGTPHTSTTTLSNTDLDQDFGYAGSGTIGDTIWFDRNGDGSIDGDEAPLPGIDVTITWDSPTGPIDIDVTTDANGEYLVENLPPGDYTVTVDTGTLPTGMNATYDNDGGLDATSDLTLADGATNTDQDFGFNGTGTIGDTIYLDLDGDGSQGVGEPGVPGQRVDIVWTSPSGPVTFTTTTDVDGNYSFENLPPGDYTVTVIDGIVTTTINTDDPGADGDSTNALTLANGAADLDQDFGYQGANAVGDTVWFDVDGDGVIDTDEPRLESVQVTVTWFGFDGVSGGGDDAVVGTTLTDVDGLYQVTGLPDGSFSVAVTGGLPIVLDTVTGDPDDTNDGASVVDLSGGETDLDQDFGYIGSAAIGDTIFIDVDTDGVQDADEPGVEALIVTIVSPGLDGVAGNADDVTLTLVTDEDGVYRADGLVPGPTSVTYDATGIDAGYVADSDVDGGDPSDSTVTLGTGEQRLDVDFGIIGDATVSGTVWIDTDGDGERDPGEVGIPNVTVEVTWDGPDGPTVLRVQTDANGDWMLEDVPPGDYTTQVIVDEVPDGLVPTTPTDGATTIPIGGTGSVSNGFVEPGSIGDRVWSDADGDGVQDTGEVGIADVTVVLIDAGGTVVATTTTAADGSYRFEQLPPGTYTVQVTTTTLPAGSRINSELDVTTGGSTDGVVQVILTAGQVRSDADFGVILPRLAFTGTATGTIVVFGLGLIALGLILASARRRPQVIRVRVED